MHSRDLEREELREPVEPAAGDAAAAAQRAQGVAEIVLATVLASSGLLTSWSGYQATLWSGEQDRAYSETNDLRIEAARTSARADLLRTADLAVFTSWLGAAAAGEERLQTFYRNRFRGEFAAAFDEWMALDPLNNRDAPETPFAMPVYHSAIDREAEEIEARADAAFAKAEEDDRVADTYVQATVIFATAMFLAGICQVFKHQKVKVGLTVLSALICALGVMRVIGLPALAL